MPRQIQFAPDAALERRGHTDYVQTTTGRKPVRVFNGATGQWRTTATGKKWFARDGQPQTEYVLQLPAVFRTHKTTGTVTHRGWYPVANLPTALRRQLEQAFPAHGAAPPVLGVGQGRAGILASVKAAVKRILSTRVDPDLGEEVQAFESDQLITLDPARDWRFSELHTEVQNGDADVQAFLNMPMRGLPDNSQLLHFHDITPAAYDTPISCRIY